MELPPWFSISLWILLGYSMILFNKILLTSWGFRFPFFLTTWHCILATVLTQILSRTTNLFPAVQENKINFHDYIKKIVPLAVLFAYGLVAGNLAYQFISLSYIQMIKAVTPVPLLLLSFATGREKPSVVQLFIVMVVSFGVLLSSIGELRFSLLGFLLQASAVCTDCFRMLFLDILLKDAKIDSLSMLYYTAPVSAILIGAGFMYFEFPNFSMDILTPNLYWTLLANGLLAFFLNLAVLFLVSNCSAVIMSVSGPIKDILIVFTSVALFKAPVTLLQIVGFSISIFGLNLYRQFKANPSAMHHYGRELRSNAWDAVMFTIRSLTSTTSDINVVMGVSEKEQEMETLQRDEQEQLLQKIFIYEHIFKLNTVELKNKVRNLDWGASPIPLIEKSMSANTSNTLPPWLCIVTWISLGYSMIMFNKIILTSSGFNFPFFLTTWHCVLGTILTQVLSCTTNMLPAVTERKVTVDSFFKKLLPVSFLFAYGLVAGNIAYGYISLSFIQMIKSVAPVPMLLLSFAFGREKATWLQFFIVVIVSGGVMMTSIGELKFSLFGFVIQLSAVLFDCLRMSLMDILLKDIKLDSLSLLYYTAPTSAFFIGIGFFVFEYGHFPYERLDVGFCVILLFNGLLAFSLNLAVIFLISNTSPVVLSVSGPIKDILIVMTSVVLFNTDITILQVVGYSISMFGLYLFREYKSDASGLRNKLLHARSVLCEHVCFIFTVAPKTDDEDDVEGGGGGVAGGGGDSGGSGGGAVKGVEMQERETAPLLTSK